MASNAGGCPSFLLAQGAREVNQTSTKIKEGQIDFFPISTTFI